MSEPIDLEALERTQTWKGCECDRCRDSHAVIAELRSARAEVERKDRLFEAWQSNTTTQRVTELECEVEDLREKLAARDGVIEAARVVCGMDVNSEGLALPPTRAQVGALRNRLDALRRAE